MPVSELQQIVGRTLIGATGIADGFIDDLSATVARARENWKTTSEILEIVRNAIAEFEPLLAEHLSDTVLSAWINGYDNVAKQFPLWLQQEFTDSIRRRPPQDPPTVSLFGMFDREPRLRLLNIENAAKRLFERRILTRDAFDEAEDSAKTQAFTIAGGLGSDTIERFRQWLYQDLQEGTSFRSFKNRVEDHLGSSPIAPSHLENVYRTNVQSSFRDGRETLRQNPLVTAAFPYQEYMPIEDGRVRHEHLMLGKLGLDGTGIYRIDDPIWDYFTPPWDYNCRCGTRLLTLEQAAKAGVKEAQQWLKTGRPPLRPEFRYATIPFSPNPGWGSRGNVGVIVMSSMPNRCPSGYTAADPLVINGKHYTGGMFIPHDEMQHATAEQKHEIQSGKKKESAPTAEPPQQAAPANWVRSLTVGHKLKLPSGYKASIAYDSKANSRGWYAKITDAESGSTTFPKRFSKAADAAQYAADTLRARSLDAPPKPKLGKPDKFKPEKKPRSKRPTVKTLGEADLRYKSLDFVSAGAKTKFRDNLAALRVLKHLEIEERPPTKEEQETISKFVGWGQFKAAFDYNIRGGTYGGYSHWSKERDELKALVGEDGYEAARASTTNSHYTAPEVVEAHWKMAQKLGFNGGRMLEPAVGSGYYLGLMPEDIAKKTSVTGVDMDSTATRIAKALYPSANIHNSPFERHSTPNNFYDLVASNVPFDGDVHIYDPRYKFRPAVHDYFFMRSVDTAKPGGLIMHLTSTGTMDKGDSRVRDYIDKHCELVSAVRFPGGTHKDNAGTEVVTDMLILRKKNPAIPEATDETPENARPERSGFTGTTVDSLGRLYHWVDGVRVPAPKWGEIVTMPDPDGGEPIPINQYFADRPEQMLGRLDRTGTMYTGKMMNVTRTEDYEKLLQDAIDRLPANIVRTSSESPQEERPRERIESDKKYNEGQYVVVHGELYQYSSGALTPLTFAGDGEERARGQIMIRDAGRALIEAQRNRDGVDEAREHLNQVYDDFIAKYGYLHNDENRKVFNGDSDSTFMLALEKWNAMAKKGAKADIFTTNTIRQDERAEKAETVAEATGIVLHETASIDIERIAQLTGQSIEDVEDELVEKGLAFHDPNGKWESASRYLSGLTKDKLALAKTAAATDPRYEANVKALEARQPVPIDKEEIGIAINSSWLPPNIISQFVSETLGGPADMMTAVYVPELGEWHAKYKNEKWHQNRGNEIWGVTDDNKDVVVRFDHILKAALSGKSITVRSAFKNDQDKRPILLEQTEEANNKVQELKEQFEQWVWEDEERAKLISDTYNELKNVYVEEKHDGSHLVFPGMKDSFQMRDVQKNAAWRIITTGKGLLAHEVGLGKTPTLIASGMELRRLGLAKKPAICVPKSTLNQMTLDAIDLYPGAKILSTGDLFDNKTRQEALNTIATGDYDLVVLSYEHLNYMKMKPEVVKKFIDQEISQLRDAIIAAEGNKTLDKKVRTNIVGDLESRIQSLAQTLHSALNESKKDDIFFEDSGIDFLMVDEAHNFKSLPCVYSGENIKGIPKSRSQRATNMYMRTQWLMEQHNGRGVVFATGTPIANTMGEMYNMQRYLQGDLLRKTGNDKFDSWKDTFGRTVEKNEYTWDGKVAVKKRFSNFVNLPELRHLSSDFMDVAHVDQLGFQKNADGSDKLDDDGNPIPVIPRPIRRDKLITIPPSSQMKDFMASIADRALAVKGKRPMKGEDGMLQISQDARKGSIDLRLVVPDAPDYPDSKANRAISEILRVYKENPGKTQAVFSDEGIHIQPKTGFSLFNDMINKLVAAGVPRDKIVNFSDKKLKVEQAEKLKAAMRRGEVLIAFGSTEKLGTGTNVQDHLLAVHHLDIPYVPADSEQRNGRAHRFGNKNKAIEIYNYIQQGSSDHVSLQLQAKKMGFIKQYMRGGPNRTMSEADTESFSPDEMIAIATGDPSMIERLTIKEEIKSLKRQEVRHYATQSRHQQTIAEFPEQQAAHRQRIANHKSDLEHIRSEKEFRLQLANGVTATREVAKEHLQNDIDQAIREARDDYRGKPRLVARFKGMPVYATAGATLEVEGPSGERYSASPSLEGLERVGAKIERSLARLEDMDKAAAFDIEKIKSQVGPWKRQAELAAKEARLAVLEPTKQAMSLAPGTQHIIDGVTYVLNRNHRWQRQDQAQPPQPAGQPQGQQPQPDPAAPAPAPQPETIQLAATDGDSPQHRQARQTVALHYLSTMATYYNHAIGKLQPLDPPRIHGMLDGIDTSKPVVLGPPPTIPPPTKMVQWQAKGGHRGSYFSEPGVRPEQIGIYSKAVAWTLPGKPILPREPVVIDTRKTKFDRVSYLHSTAAPTVDTWSVPGKPVPVSGGGPQYFIPVAAHPAVKVPVANEQATASN